MRTTIDLPDDLLGTAKAMARSRKQTLGQTVAELMRLGLRPAADEPIRISPRTGLPVIHLGRVTTMEDVKALEDDE